MGTTSDLMGSGMSPALASLLDFTPVSITASGTAAAQASAATIPYNTGIALITAASAPVAATIFSTAFAIGTPCFAVNLAASAVTASVFCPVSGTMNGTTNGSVLLTTGKSAIFVQTTAGVWISVPLTP